MCVIHMSSVSDRKKLKRVKSCIRNNDNIFIFIAEPTKSK